MNKKEISDSLLEEKYKIFWKGKAHYDEENGCCIGGYRYKLEITNQNPSTTKKNKGTLACIMMNPSTTFPNIEWENPDWKNKLNFPTTQKQKTKGFDPTVRNVIRMAHSKGYTKVCIFNLFPYIQPKSNTAKKKYKNNQDKNKEIITNWDDINCKKILVAWGANSPTGYKNKKEYLNLQKEYIKIFLNKGITPVYYEWNIKKNAPYHPSIQVNNSWTKDTNENIIKRNKKNKFQKGIIDLFIESNTDFKKFPNNYF